MVIPENINDIVGGIDVLAGDGVEPSYSHLAQGCCELKNKQKLLIHRPEVTPGVRIDVSRFFWLDKLCNVMI